MKWAKVRVGGPDRIPQGLLSEKLSLNMHALGICVLTLLRGLNVTVAQNSVWEAWDCGKD